MKMICEAVTAHWGERCPEFDTDCYCCQAWAEVDKMKWKPIETAPKGENAILVYAKMVGWEYFVVKWIDDRWFTLDSDFNPFHPLHEQPSHWQTLSEPE